MQRLFNPFRALRWKLTLSYTLVTVAALLVVELLGLGAAMIFILNSDFIPRMAARVLVLSAPQAAPYLEKTPPDQNGLRIWLLKGAVNGFSVEQEGEGTVSFYPGSFNDDNSQLVIVDVHQNLLAIAPEEEDTRLGERYEAQPDLQPLLDTALAGETDYTRLYLLTPDKRILLAAPILSSEQRVLGVLLYSTSVIPVDSPFQQLVSLFGVSAVGFTLAAGIVGTIFGFLTARGLSRRLRTVSQAADSWSRGDFSVFVRDRSGDELGQLSQRLNLMAEQLQNLLHTNQELAALEERNRLARDLHDTVKQQVFATAMQVGAARALLQRDPQAAEARLAEADQLARQAQAELSNLIRELRPAALQGRGLIPALQEHAADWSRQNEITALVSQQGERPLPLNIEQALFRVAQEALSNVARHSGADRVDLHLAWQRDEVTLSITDNGAGIASGAATKGLGLQSMRERIEALGGKLTIESTPGQGTRVIAVVGSPKNDREG